MPPSAPLEPLFHAVTLDLLVPATGSGIPSAPGRSEGGYAARREWWANLRSMESRETAFLDEKLAFAVAVSIPWPAEDDEEPPTEVLALAQQLQLTATASFLPPLQPQQRAPGPSPVERKQPAPVTPIGLGPSPVDQKPPFLTTPVSATAPSGTALTPINTRTGADGAPQTPVPQPVSTPTGQAYAGIDGVVVWEGLVETPDGSRPTLFRSEEGWTAVWRGEMPVIYVRTTIQNPVLALTASATLRESAQKRKSTATMGDSQSVYSMTTLRTEISEVEDDEKEAVDLAEMEEIDLLGGLTDVLMPASRLGPSLRDDLSVRAPPSPSATATPGTPFPARTPRTPLTTSTTLRKSFRKVLGLSPGLRVRMRTLFLPQLLPPNELGEDADSDDAGERRVVLCVEIENSADAGHHAFEIEGVLVDIGGKGAKVGSSLHCQPGQEESPPKSVFPLRLEHLEQYNLLYSVDIPSSPTGGRGDEHRPVSIVLNGRPCSGSSDKPVYLTPSFQSRWNCALDLAPFYASLPPAPPAPQAHAPQSRQVAHRLSKPTPPTPNAIAGDKRYSLSYLVDKHGPPGASDRRLVSNPARPFMPSTANRVMSTRGPHSSNPIGDGHGLLVSVKVLPPERDAETETISALDTFSIEVFVHNRTDGVRRFRLSIPPTDTLEGRIRDAWIRKRRRTAVEPAYGADDSVLAALLTQHEASAPGLIPLETDVRCGPVLPSASLAARIRFLALRNGVHRIERMRITGIGEDFDFVISPVLEVVVGDVS